MAMLCARGTNFEKDNDIIATTISKYKNKTINSLTFEEFKILLLYSDKTFTVLNSLGNAKNVEKFIINLSGTEIKTFMSKISPDDKVTFYNNKDISGLFLCTCLRYDPGVNTFIDRISDARKVELLESCNNTTVYAANILLSHMDNSIRNAYFDDVRNGKIKNEVVKRLAIYKKYLISGLKSPDREAEAEKIFKDRIFEYGINNASLQNFYETFNKEINDVLVSSRPLPKESWKLAAADYAKLEKDFNECLEAYKKSPSSPASIKTTNFHLDLSKDSVRERAYNVFNIQKNAANKSLNQINVLAKNTVEGYVKYLTAIKIYEEQNKTKKFSQLSTKDQEDVCNSILGNPAYKSQIEAAVNSAQWDLYVRCIKNHPEDKELQELINQIDGYNSTIVDYLHNKYPEEVNLSTPCIRSGFDRTELMLLHEDEILPSEYLSDAYLGYYWQSQVGLDDEKTQMFTFQGINKGAISFGGSIGRVEGTVGLTKEQIETIKKDRRIFDDDGEFILATAKSKYKAAIAQSALSAELGGVYIPKDAILINTTRSADKFTYTHGGLEGAFTNEWWIGGITSGYRTEFFTNKMNVVFEGEDISLDKAENSATISLADGSKITITSLNPANKIEDIISDMFDNYKKSCKDPSKASSIELESSMVLADNALLDFKNDKATAEFECLQLIKVIVSLTDKVQRKNAVEVLKNIAPVEEDYADVLIDNPSIFDAEEFERFRMSRDDADKMIYQLFNEYIENKLSAPSVSETEDKAIGR